MEIELKLSLPASALPALLRHPLVASAPIHQKKQKLINVYYDTPDLALHRARVAVRTRKAGRTWLQTIKCASESVGGLSSRPEWEQAYKNNQFDFTAITDATARDLLEQHAKNIKPIFATTFQRETRLIQPDSNTNILMMIDHGEITSQEKKTGLCEVELELAEGDPMQLFDVALCLAVTLPLLPEDTSKAERGYRLYLNETQQPATCRYSPLRNEQSALHAYRDLSYAALQAWQANTSGILNAESVEASLLFVPEYQESIRQLRFLLKIFAPVLNKKFVKHWQHILKTLSAQPRSMWQWLALQQLLLTDDFAESASSSALKMHIDAMHQQTLETLRYDLQHSGWLMLAYSQALHSILDTSEESQNIKRFTVDALSRLHKTALKRYSKSEKTAHKNPWSLFSALERLEKTLTIFSTIDQAKESNNIRQYLQPVISRRNGLKRLDLSFKALNQLEKAHPDMDCSTLKNILSVQRQNRFDELKRLLSTSAINL